MVLKYTMNNLDNIIKKLINTSMKKIKSANKHSEHPEKSSSIAAKPFKHSTAQEKKMHKNASNKPHTK